MAKPNAARTTLPGELAPEFRLKNDIGEMVSLQETLQKGPVMLAFYPKDFGLICTKQLCSYQDAQTRFAKYGVEVLGISANAPDSHKTFKERYQFGFQLLSDPDRAVFRTYQVTSLFMLGGTSRAVFIISKSGSILYRYIEPTLLTHRKPLELLAILDGLKGKGLL